MLISSKYWTAPLKPSPMLYKLMHFLQYPDMEMFPVSSVVHVHKQTVKAACLWGQRWTHMRQHCTALGRKWKKEKDQHTRYQLQHTNYITAEETWCHLGNHWEMINETLCVVLWNDLYIKNESVHTRTHMFCFTSSHCAEVQARTGLREECSLVATQRSGRQRYRETNMEIYN